MIGLFSEVETHGLKGVDTASGNVWDVCIREASPVP